MDESSRKEWPTVSYKEIWKLFRRMSNENEVTAEHLLSRSHWPKVQDITLLDIGCGDGLLAERIVLLNKHPVAEVRLLDPDQEFINEATAHIVETGVMSQATQLLGYAEDLFGSCCKDAHAILAVHVVYLLKDGVLQQLLDMLPVGIPLYVVLDTPDSVFSKLWSKTAEKYSKRSANAHGLLNKLPTDQFEVNYSTITSRLDNPLNHEQPAIRESVLSLLCYAEMKEMTDAVQKWVYDQVRSHTVGDHVHCESACYEVLKLAK